MDINLYLYVMELFERVNRYDNRRNNDWQLVTRLYTETI